MYNIIAHTLCRDDGMYLDEWMDYHSGLGVEHFIVYDHKSIVPVVNKWGDKVTVVRADVPEIEAPLLYNNTLKNFKSVWLATFDMDEFIVLFKHKDLHELFNDYKEYGGLTMNWLVYGSSGHTTIPPGLVKDNYLWRTEPNYSCNVHLKTFSQMQYCKRIYNVHTCLSTKPIVNEDFKIMDGALGESSRTICRLNHYMTRSLEDYQRKIEIGKRIGYVEYANMVGFEDVQKNCLTFDDILKDWGTLNRGHHYGIAGWFNFENLYSDMVNKFDNAVFVEIGCWKGRSTIYMADQIKNSKKNIKFYGIDIWEPYIQGDGVRRGASFEEFLYNIKPVQEYITPIKGSSHDVFEQFADKSIDFLYIDADHNYEFIKKDIELWYPKMKKGGLMGGHDYQFEGVGRAVNEFFADKGKLDMTYYDTSSSWLVMI